MSSPVNVDSLQIEIEASSNSAAAQIDELTKALRRLKRQADKGTGLEKVKSDLDGVSVKTSSAAKALKAVRSGIKLISFRQIVNYLGSAVNSINDFVENMNLFQVSMGKFYDEAYDYAMLVNDKLGVDPSAWMRTQGVFMSMAKGFGMSEQQAYDLSESLTELSYDIGSLYNEDVEMASKRLQSALAGEIEPIRRLGISISQATLQEFAMAKGIDESVASMTEQEKALLRSLKLIEGASDIGAIGDFTRTLESPANSLRVFNQQLEQMKRAIGSVMLPVIIQVLPYMQAFVNVLTDAISRLATLLGLKMPSWDNSDWNKAYSGGADAVGEATDAVKKLKKETMGIDELTILGDKPGASDVDGISGWAASLEIQNLWDKKAIAEIETQAETVKGKIEGALSGIEYAIIDAPIAIGAMLALSGINMPLGLAMMAGGLYAKYKAVKENWDTADTKVREGLIGSLAESGAFLLTVGALMAFSGAALPLGIAMMAAGGASLVAAGALNWNTAEEKVSSSLTLVEGAMGGFFLGLGAVLAFSGVSIPAGIALMASGAAHMIASKSVDWTSVGTETENELARIEGIVGISMLALGAILALTGVALPVGIALMAGGATTLAAAYAPRWSGLSDDVKSTMNTISTTVGWAMLGLGALLALTGVATPLGLALMASGGVSLATAYTPKWSTLVDKTKEVFDSIKKTVSEKVRGIKDVIKEMFTFKVNVGYSGSTGSYGMFADGGFPDHGQMFIAREAGPELVGTIGNRTAVANNDQIVAGIASGVASANDVLISAVYSVAQQVIQAINEKDTSTYIDSKKITTAQNQRSRAYGV